MSDAVPTLDARDVQSAKFAQDIAAAYAEYGFVIIQNHGIDKALIDRCLDCFQQFFALPTEEKLKYKLPERRRRARLHGLRRRDGQGRDPP